MKRHRPASAPQSNTDNSERSQSRNVVNILSSFDLIYAPLNIDQHVEDLWAVHRERFDPSPRQSSGDYPSTVNDH